MAAIQEKFTLSDPVKTDSLDYAEPNKTYNLDVPDIIPMCARKIYLMSATRSGGEELSFVNIKVWTRNPSTNVCNYHHNRFFRYPQSAISYDSETFGLPLYHDRKIYAFTDHCQINNCHKTELFVVGWKI